MIRGSQLQVLPCGVTLTVKVFKHTLLQSSVEVYRPTIIRLATTVSLAGEKYLIKVAPSYGHEFQRSQIFSLAVSTAPQFAQLPMLPSNTEVEDVPGRETCNSAWIMWHSSPDPRPIRYSFFFKYFFR